MQKAKVITALRAQLEAGFAQKHLPSSAADWWLLRSRWEKYSSAMRALVLCHAKLSADLPLERYSKGEKLAIAQAIADLKGFAECDEALMFNLKRLRRRLQQPDE